MSRGYNGYTEAEIEAGRAKIAEAEATGWSYVRKCEICGNGPRDGAAIVAHCEDWSKPVECVRPLCIFCEDAVTGRFNRPKRFLKLLHRARQGHKSPVFQTRALFLKAQSHGRPDEREEIDTPDELSPLKWWEQLKLFYVDHRSMSKRQFAAIRGPVQVVKLAGTLF